MVRFINILLGYALVTSQITALQYPCFDLFLTHSGQETTHIRVGANLTCVSPALAPTGQVKGRNRQIPLGFSMNVASRCGFTPQYSALESLYEKYKDQGLVILGFPANNFGAQEPGTNAEIKSFCTLKYNVTFPMFAKVSVKGADTTPLYQYLTQQANPTFTGDIKWNFTKFLVDRSGKVVARFESRVKPDSPEVVEAIEKLLKQ
jgi:glutathione peroxidase